MLFCPSTKKMGEDKDALLMFMMHDAQCSVQLMLFLIKKKKYINDFVIKWLDLNLNILVPVQLC